MRDCITNPNAAACQYALRRHLPPLRSVLVATQLSWTALPGAAMRFAAGREAEAA
jgi:hypothetical protein